MTMASRPTVVIFCDHLLYLWETSFKPGRGSAAIFPCLCRVAQSCRSRVAGGSLLHHQLRQYCQEGFAKLLSSYLEKLPVWFDAFTPSIQFWFMRISVPMVCGRCPCRGSSACRSS